MNTQNIVTRVGLVHTTQIKDGGKRAHTFACVLARTGGLVTVRATTHGQAADKAADKAAPYMVKIGGHAENYDRIDAGLRCRCGDAFCFGGFACPLF